MSESQLSPAAQRILEDPLRARSLLVDLLESGQTMSVSLNGKDYEINNFDDIQNLPDEVIVWCAKQQAEHELWLEKNELTQKRLSNS